MPDEIVTPNTSGTLPTEEAVSLPNNEPTEEQVAPILPSPQEKIKKLFLFALIPLLLIGLGFSGYYVYQNFLRPAPVTQTTPVTTQKELAVPLTLAITAPSDNSVLTDSLMTIKGVTLPNTTVFFYTEENENSVDSDAKGNFEGQIKLADGINTLTVTAFNDNGEEKTLSYNLVYDNQVMGVKNTPTKTGADNNGKKAVVGNVERVTANSIVTGKDKKTTEIEVDKNTKIINQNKKQVNLNSLKKSDMTAIITDDEQTIPNQKLKKALKIYVRDEATSTQIQSKRKAVSGIIQSISGNLITLTHQIQTDRVYQLYTDSLTVVKIKDLPTATIADLKSGQRIAAVGNLNAENQLVAKRIHVIPGKATGVMNKYPSPEVSVTPTGTIISPTPAPSGTVTVTPIPTPSGTITATPTIEATPTP